MSSVMPTGDEHLKENRGKVSQRHPVLRTIGQSHERPKRLHHVEMWSDSILERRTSMFRDPLKPFGF